MANLKEIRTRIASVKSTRQITSAMKMVSAAKLRKAQDLIIQMRPYAYKLAEILGNVSASVNPDENPYAQQRSINRVLIVVITSNRGLCGAFNANIVKRAEQKLKNEYQQLQQNEKVDLFCIGKKGAELLRNRGYNVIKSEEGIFDNISFENFLPVIETFLSQFLKGQYDKIDIVYNRFKNAATQLPTYEPFLPLTWSDHDDNDDFSKIATDYIFEPSKEYIISELIPRSLKIYLYSALLDSNASEHGARMTSMHQATDNATELIKTLTLDYNKARQASITNEILEIVGGAEALNG